MTITNVRLEDLKPYDKNAKKHNQKQIDNVAESIKEYGFVQPLVIDEDGVIVIGHCRALAAKKLGLEAVPCVMVKDLTPEQIKALRIVDNKTNESEWDFGLVLDEIIDLDLSNFDFSWDVKTAKFELDKSGVLYDRFIVPPFSVLDTRSANWQKRKKVWNNILPSANGRGDNLIGGGGLKGLAQSLGQKGTGTSVFDPVLCEVLINWFSPARGKIIDPFAGGATRGIVAEFIGRDYYGCDLSKTQIEANEKIYEQLNGADNFYREPLRSPHWYCGDSTEIDSIIDEGDFDMLLTCPPYADLEVYSDDPRDISTMDYDDFKRAYETILCKSVAKLKENAFAVIVVGEVRDKNGVLRNFIGDTITICERLGLKYYNEIVFLTSWSTAGVRATRQFNGGRKVVSTHQKGLVFLRSNGDEQKLADFIASFDDNRDLMPMKESALVFLKGKSNLTAGDVADYEFPDF